MAERFIGRVLYDPVNKIAGNLTRIPVWTMPASSYGASHDSFDSFRLDYWSGNGTKYTYFLCVAMGMSWYYVFLSRSQSKQRGIFSDKGNIELFLRNWEERIRTESLMGWSGYGHGIQFLSSWLNHPGSWIAGRIKWPRVFFETPPVEKYFISSYGIISLR